MYLDWVLTEGRTGAGPFEQQIVEQVTLAVACGCSGKVAHQLDQRWGQSTSFTQVSELSHPFQISQRLQLFWDLNIVDIVTMDGVCIEIEVQQDMSAEGTDLILARIRTRPKQRATGDRRIVIAGEACCQTDYAQLLQC